MRAMQWRAGGWRAQARELTTTWQIVLRTSRKRNYLTLEKKIEIIKHAQKNTGISVKALGELFNCGKMRVSRILKSKESLLALYESDVSASKVHTSMIQRQ